MTRRKTATHRRMAALHLEQLTLGLEWSHEDVRRSLVVLTTPAAIEPEPTRIELRARRAA